MKRHSLSEEERKIDTDLWIILLVTLAVFFCYIVMQKQIMDYVKNDSISIIPRLLLNASIQFGIAGLGISIVCVFRKEKFAQFGLVQKNLLKSILGTIISFIPCIICIVLSGQFRGYQPFNILVTEDVIASGFPFPIIGMALIVIVWGFFEGFNYAVICEKINRRYPSKNQWLDYGAITCAIVCILFHPINTSFWGIAEIITTFIAIYGMLIVRKKTGNSWGCVFAFLFIWNAI